MTRQGKCDHCKCAYTWTLNVKLADQRCDQCRQPLTRITTTRGADGHKTDNAQGYTWSAWR